MSQNRILTLHDWSHEELQHQADELMARVGTAIRPILFYDERRRPHVEGTGILVQVPGHRFLLTAAHVIESRHELFLGGSDAMYSLEGPRTSTVSPQGRTRYEDPFDLAWVELAPEYVPALGAVAWLAPEDLCSNYVPQFHGANRTRYLLVGYPSTKLKWRAPERLVDPQRIVFEANSVEPTLYQSLGRAVDTHVVLEYPKRRALTVHGQRELPKPRGVSGGALFLLPEIRPLVGGSLGRPRLAAVVTDWPVTNRKVLLATRLNVGFTGLAQYLEAVAPSP